MGSATTQPRTLAGRDAFGPIALRRDECVACNRAGMCVVWQTGPEFPDYEAQDGSSGPLSATRLILKRSDAPIGLLCGCYAKLHRQVAHITTEAKIRRDK